MWKFDIIFSIFIGLKINLLKIEKTDFEKNKNWFKKIRRGRWSIYIHINYLLN